MRNIMKKSEESLLFTQIQQRQKECKAATTELSKQKRRKRKIQEVVNYFNLIIMKIISIGYNGIITFL